MSSLESNITKLHIIACLQGILFAVPVMVLFWQSHGLSMYEVMLLQSLFAVSMVIFEVPTGYFADRMTKKMSLILGGLFLVLGHGIYGISETFSSFLIAELTLALGFSFLSGAQSAFLYETLLALSREDEHTKILGHNEFLRYISLATSQIVGGFMAVYFSYNLLLLSSVPFLFFGFILTLTLSEPKILVRETERHVSSVESFLSVIREHFHPSGKLLTILVISSLILGLTQAALWLYQPYFAFSGVSVVYFGFIFASFQIVAAFASKYAHSIEKKLGQATYASASLLLTLSYLSMALFIFPFGFVFAYAQQTIRGFLLPVVATEVNRYAPSAYRATLLSLQNLGTKLFYALVILFVGAVVDRGNVISGIILLALLSGIMSLIVIVWKRKK